MSNSQPVYHIVSRSIVPNCPTQRVTQACNLAWFITGVIVSAQCQLTGIARHVLWDGYCESAIQRLRRVLTNLRLTVRTLYGPTVAY